MSRICLCAIVWLLSTSAASADLFDRCLGRKPDCIVPASLGCSPTCTAPSCCVPCVPPTCLTPGPSCHCPDHCNPVHCSTCAAPSCCAPCAPSCQAPCVPSCQAPCPPSCHVPCDPCCHVPLGCTVPCNPSLCCDACCYPCCPSPDYARCGRPGLLRFLCGGFPFCEIEQWRGRPPCGNSTCDGSCRICCEIYCAEAAEVCELVSISTTSCDAYRRKWALQRLSNRFDCDQYPDVMSALVCALQDCDERVRRTAADEIGDQLRRHPCCCNAYVVCALSNAVYDCDRRVSREAAQALRACEGCNLVTPCCETYCCAPCCEMFCDSCTNDWIAPQAEGRMRDAFPEDDFEEGALDAVDPRQEYNPPPIEDRPFVPPSPTAPSYESPSVDAPMADEAVNEAPPMEEPAAERFVPGVVFPPTAASSAAPIRGLRSSVEATGWIQ